MSLKDIFQRNRAKQLDTEPEEGGDSELMAGNDAVRKKQLLYLGCGGAVALVLGSWYVMGDDAKLKPVGTDGKEVKITTDDMVNRNMSQREWQAASEAQMQSINNQLKGVDGQRAQMEQLQAQIAALQGEKQSMASDGQRVMSAYQQENDQLRQQIAQRNAAPAAPAPTQMYGPGQPNYRTPGAPMTAGEAAAAAVSQSRSIKLVSFEGGPSGTATRISGGTTSYTDSPNYLPPNSIAKAKVIVGVDASAGVQSQTDPLPVILRITGPARSVYQNGKLLTTRIEGCVINGAARGDLSSEKVYVKLQRMTCPQANGRFAVSDVKGFISFAGKTGVRGRVVSREGSLAMQAFFAGLVGGAGNALNTAFNQPLATFETDGKGGINRTPSIGNVGLRALGGGADQSGRTVSKYLIERAEQYQPIIEMPTGIDVEIVFLEGVFIQN
ncbi:conjugal transfer pilus assembly protein TraB [Sphingomonas sp. OV641]|jgi:conjugal transfer pilus assembly protein TraB|uniref:TraB/VirB10 family protein n=2 Tax=Sphingomonas TaxID=13687 RepID=A0ABW4NLG5_9SPHN|nr:MULTISPECIES: TraB/VirB10 family protein [Sphingomonas]MBM3926873.1 conjugal transfer protein TraB [Sphingomonadales bacterium]MDE0877237.1 TraB/VirB10 family protein [Sphingomonas bacterium]SEK00504.1 conjugal transfer pilus assembly protein TraB [Sphingomonas sp. OV641]